MERAPELRLGGGRALFASAEMAGVGGLPSPPEESSRGGPLLGVVTARHRQSEGQRAIAEMWGVLALLDAVGAEVEFTFWTSGGTLTMTSWRCSAEGGGHGEPVDARAFARGLQALAALVGDEPRFVHVTQRRERSSWATSSLRFSPGSPPPESRTLPVDAPGVPAGAFAELEHEARVRWVPLLRAPRDGTASLELRVDFEDGRRVGSVPLRWAAKGTEAAVDAPPGFDTRLASALVPFTQGLGSRSVRVVLEATRSPGDASPSWRITSATTLRPVRVEAMAPWTTSTEFRLLHEELIRRWREDMRGAAVLAASFTTEQLALYVVGGWAARGMGAMLEVAAGSMTRVLGRGGPAAVEWLESLLVRIPKPERDAFARAWTQVETKGFKALSEAEQAELRATIQRLEQQCLQPISKLDKKYVRNLAGDQVLDPSGTRRSRARREAQDWWPSL